MPPRALPSSKPKTAAEKWKAWLASEYKDEQKLSANLVCCFHAYVRLSACTHYGWIAGLPYETDIDVLL